MRAMLLYAGVALGGAVAGSAATYLLIGPADPPVSPYAAATGRAAQSELTASGAASSLRARDLATEPGPLPTSDRLAVYAYATDSTQPEALEAQIQRAAALPHSHRRAFELDALLMRLSELDAGRAVRLALELRVETEHLIPLFQFWAEQDTDAALAALRRVGNPGTLRAIALSLLDVFGDDERGIERLADVLSPAQIPAFRLDALVRLTAQDPYGALQRALALDDQTTRANAITRIAAEWTRQDPEAALAQVETIADGAMRQSFQSGVLSEWARIDPDGVLAYLRSGTPPGLPILAAVVTSLAPADPEAVLELAEQMPADNRRMAQQAALRVIAERDPYAAIAMLDGIPSNRDRDLLVSAIGQAFARQDPEAALEWAKSLRPPSANAIMNVVSAIAASDPERAVDLVLDGDFGAGMSSSLPFMLMSSTLGGSFDSSRMGAIASRLIERNDPVVANQVQTLVSGWSRRDPEAALDWLMSNAERAGRPALMQAATELASQDPIAAANLMSRLPPDLQDDWLQSVAAGYAAYDPEAAAEWIMQYQGRDGFATGLAAIAPSLAQTDPWAAVRLLDQVDGPAASLAGAQVASAWAATEPEAAADWAARLDDPAARANAIGSVTYSWANRDPDGARRWALNLPRGDSRDQALQRLLPVSAAAAGNADTQLLDAFSNDEVRQNALLSSAMQLANRDPGAARELIEQHITDPSMKQQAYDMVERTSVRPAIQSLILR